MKGLKSSFGAGVLFAVFIAIIALVFSKGWEVAKLISSWVDLKIFEKEVFNTAIYFLLVLVALCFVGAVLKVKVLRAFMSNVPVISTVMKFLPKGDEIDNLTDGGIKEVRITIAEVRGLKICARGLITKTWKEGGKAWIRVYVASCPLPMTGYLIEMEFDPAIVEYTGRRSDEYTAMVMSFGIRSNEKENPS